MTDAEDGRKDDINRLLFEPNAAINGAIDDNTLTSFLDQIADMRSGNQDLVLELNTVGGDADVARRIALEIRLFSRHAGRSAYCVGKSYVYSAGVTILAAFDRQNRYLTADAFLLIHERRISGGIELSGPMTACIQMVQEELAMLETAQRLEKEGFDELVKGSKMSSEELFRCARKNCYMSAQDALSYGLVGRILS
ncbi:ATP-dependent Clp protease proteolytic subunit [Rhizobium esperanzae]|uniref:ATP-dependent protease ClpP protease subunit n=1 Tax=Rhizobium esperanzae TaxID=1967781 RepID=A0A7W6R7T0_9HYPH|nr:ATP-dependent Clp protease proteolytic subunit [Rhizobium esperanzae]MBB4237938.1 ATP-dependent protease ClpP protease subunit [Rhizobium esperanzae]